MDPFSAIAGCKQIITQCTECTIVLAKWMGQARAIDRRLQSFYDEVSALQLANENMKRNLEQPSMNEAARCTNDSSGHLWSQIALTMDDCKKTLVAVNQSLQNIKVPRFGNAIRVLTESVSTGELARYFERIQMFNVCLQLPLHLVTISYQLASRDGTEAAQLMVEENIFAVNTVIKNLTKRIKVLRPIYTNSRRRRSDPSRALPSESGDVDASIYENMDDFVSRANNFMSQALSVAKSRPEAPPPTFQPSEHTRRNSDWRTPDQSQHQNIHQAVSAWMPQVPAEMPTPAPSVRAQSPMSPQPMEFPVMDIDGNVEDDVNFKLLRSFVTNGQKAMDQGDFVIAQENFQEALEMLETNEFPAQLALQPCDIILMLAHCSLQQDKPEDAVNLLSSLTNPDNPNPIHTLDQGQTCTAEHLLATIYLKKSQSKDAEKSALTDAEKSALEDTNKSALKDAEKHAKSSFDGRRKLLGVRHVKTIESTQLLVDVYQAMNKKAKANAYAEMLIPQENPTPNAAEERVVSPVSRAQTMESVASITPSTSGTILPFTRSSSHAVYQVRNDLANLELNPSKATIISRTYNPFNDDDRSSSSLTTIDSRTNRDPFSLPRHQLKPRFLAIKSLSCESRDKAVDMAMRLFRNYDPEPEKILIHRTDDLKKNIRKRGSDMGLAATGHGYAPIHFFCELSDYEATTEVEILIEEGVDLGSVRYKPGLNKVEPLIPLQIAIDKGHQEIARIMIEALSAQSQIGRSVVDINSVRDRDGLPPLLAACRRGQVRIVGQLLDYGATMIGDFPDMWYGNSLLHDASVRCDTEMVKLLLEYQDGRAHRRRDIGSSIQEDKFGTTPMMYAAISNNLPDQTIRKQKLKNRLTCMRLLLENGSLRKSFEHDLRVRDKKGKDLFTYVMEEGDLKLRRLVEQFDRVGRRNAPPMELE